jgi:hypothetical protein
MNDQNTQIEADHRAFQDERQMWLDEAKALKDNLAVHTQQMQY